MAIQKRGEWWYRRTKTPAGKKTWEPLGTKDERDARTQDKILTAQEKAGQRVDKQPAYSLDRDPTPAALWEAYSDWCERNKSHGTYITEARSWKRLTSVMQPKRMSDITIPSIEGVKVMLLRKGLAPQTVNNWIRDMRTILNDAKRQKMVDSENPFKDVRFLPVEKEPVVFHSDKECERIIHTARQQSDAFYLLCALCLYAGLRKREGIYARWENRQGWRFLRVINDSRNGFKTKTNRNRAVPISSRLRDILEPYEKDMGFIIGKDEAKCGRYRWVPDKELRAAQGETGIDFTFLTLRHTFATRCVTEGNVGLTRLSEWMGNSEPVLKSNYLNMDPTDGDIERLDRTFG